MSDKILKRLRGTIVGSLIGASYAYIYLGMPAAYTVPVLVIGALVSALICALVLK